MKRLKSTLCTLALLLLPALGLAQESLPFPPTPSGSKAGPTIAQSVYAPSKPVRRLPANAPNILIIMLDDVGPALPDTYGGSIHTPTLSRIANSGISYNSFHTAAMCSPTRAALLTGRNHHRTGFGQIAELANDWDGYTGHWPATTASVAKVLGYYGYKTAAFGKWHNTPAEQTTSQGPFDRWPTGRLVGFDYFYGFLAVESSQWEPAVAEGQNGTISELLAQNLIATEIKDHIRTLNELGGLDMLGSNKTDNMYHAGWAWAGSTPFQGVKLNAGYFGGTRTPLAVSWPKSIKADKTPRTQFHHVNDIVPTIYEVLGIQYSPVSLAYFDRAPFTFNGRIDTVHIKYLK